MEGLGLVGGSVTKFGEILPLWQNFKYLGQNCEVKFSIW